MAITGIKTKFHPDALLAKTLSQWIGCARVIYNAKCDEDRYLRTYAKKYLPIGTWPKPDQTYSQFKTELTPYLSQCPSQILRNSAAIWYQAYQSFFKGIGSRPTRKTKVKGNYVWLTSELFRVKWEGAVCLLELGTVAKPIGSLRIKWNKSRIPAQAPNSVWIRRSNAGWSLAFSYDDGVLHQDISSSQHLAYLKTLDADALAELITPVDRGVAKPLHTHNAIYFVDDDAKRKFAWRNKLVKRYQRKLARQVKGSNQRKRTVQRFAKLRAKDTDVRTNFWHQTTRALVDNSKVIVLEDLKLKNMTKAAKPKVCEITGKWLKNGARAKSGLNRALLGVGLYQFEQFLTYKMKMADKPLFKVAPHHTSQECAHCGHIHPSNRLTQSGFKCQSCGHADNADHNAALVIRKRAINLILDSGTELAGTNKNVLKLRASAERSANSGKTLKAKALGAGRCLLKKKAA